MTKNIEERIEFLRQCANEYETNGSSSLTDAEYDKEYDALKELAPDHLFFSEVGGLDEEHIYGTEVKHEITMGSLSKSKNMDEFTEWLKNTYDDTDLTFVIQHKVDGLSLSCIYDNGKLQRVVTRGNGSTGIDVTKNAQYIDGILQKINCDEEVEVRGECYKDREDFYKNWAGEYANPRNFTAGAINQKDAKVTKERGLSFLAYEVVRKDFVSEEKKIEFLKENGFRSFASMNYKIVKGNYKCICQDIEEFMTEADRPNLPYDIDGIVVKLNDIKKAKAMGTTDGGKRPKSNRAIKFPTEQKETVLNGIEWSIGRTGALTPIGLLEPVHLAGTTVQRVTLHNLDFVKQLDLEIGCKILLEKSGDIIPHCVKKTKDGKSRIVAPNKCPACGTDLEWDERQVTKWCKNPSCISQLNSNIEHWFKKLGVKGIGPGIIKRLTNVETDSFGEPVVESISDMYSLEHFKSELSDVFGDKAFDNILKAINSVKEVTLAKFIESLGIGKIGRMAKDITDIAPTLEDIDKLVINDLIQIEGFAEIKAKAFVNGWKLQRKEVDKLLKHITIKETKAMSSSLNGKKFCFTGSFKDPSRGEMEAMVPENGGKLGSVGNSLDYLVWDGEIRKSKVIKAEELGIPIITQAEFLKMI